MDKQGLIHIYTGDGKGKTTAAVGQSVRMVGSGKQVLFAQFMKGQESSELLPLKNLGINVLNKNTIPKYVPFLTEDEIIVFKNEQIECFEYIIKHAHEYSLVVLDEIFSAITTDMIKAEDVINFLKNKSHGTEIILTGRKPQDEILALADYISRIDCVRHPYEKGIAARKGIEY